MAKLPAIPLFPSFLFLLLCLSPSQVDFDTLPTNSTPPLSFDIATLKGVCFYLGSIGIRKLLWKLRGKRTARYQTRGDKARGGSRQFPREESTRRKREKVLLRWFLMISPVAAATKNLSRDIISCCMLFFHRILLLDRFLCNFLLLLFADTIKRNLLKYRILLTLCIVILLFYILRILCSSTSAIPVPLLIRLFVKYLLFLQSSLFL